jgi:hypothetical protein
MERLDDGKWRAIDIAPQSAHSQLLVSRSLCHARRSRRPGGFGIRPRPFPILARVAAHPCDGINQRINALTPFFRSFHSPMVTAMRAQQYAHICPVYQECRTITLSRGVRAVVDWVNGWLTGAPSFSASRCEQARPRAAVSFKTAAPGRLHIGQSIFK